MSLMPLMSAAVPAGVTTCPPVGGDGIAGVVGSVSGADIDIKDMSDMKGIGFGGDPASNRLSGDPDRDRKLRLD
jgi:hypothetical protein